MPIEATTTPPKPLLEVRELHTHFPIKSGLLQRTTGWFRAVDGVSFHIAKGETLGLVGESGCGKTTVGRTLLRLIPRTSGDVIFDGKDVYALGGPELKAMRRRMQIIFQDPASSLNPRMRIVNILGEPLMVHGICTDKSELRERVEKLLVRCGMPKAAADRYRTSSRAGSVTHRHRAGRALEPSFIVCDEPTSALDVSIQAQILNLLKDLQRDFGLSYLFISHDMAVIQHMCDRIAVMYKGKIVEEGLKLDIINRAQHKYTQSLLARCAHGPARAQEATRRL